MKAYRGLILTNEPDWEDILRQELEEYGFEVSSIPSVTLPLSQLSSIINSDYDVILVYYAEGNYPILDLARNLRTQGFLGGLLVASASSHSLYRIGMSYPLSTIVDVVCNSHFAIEAKQCVKYALERYEDRKLGRAERDALWLSNPKVEGASAVGFRFFLNS